MAIRTYNFTFDVKRSIMPEPVFIRQNDSTGATLINVHLVDNGVPVTINGDLEFRAMTADSQNVIADTTGFSNIDIDKGAFSYALPNQLSMTPGKIRIAYFMMVDASGNASTLSFVIFVKPSADLTPSGAKNYISIVDGLIKAFNEWNETAHSSWQDFVNGNKKIIESIDPGGKVLSELIDFRHSDMLSKTFDTAKLRGDFFDNDLRDRSVNIKWFGAVGDGVADDTKAIQSAIDSLGTTGGTILIPNGIYMIKADVPEQKAVAYLFDAGGISVPSNTTINLAPGAELKAIPTDEGAYNILRLVNVHDVIISGGKIMGERDLHTPKIGPTNTVGEWGYGIALQGSSNVIIRDITLRDLWGDGINIQVGVDGKTICQNVTIDNVICDNNRRQGMSIEALEHGLVRNSIFKNTVGTAPACGIDLEPWSDVIVNNDITIENNQFLNNDNCGLLVTGTNLNKQIKVKDNYFVGNSGKIQNGQLYAQNGDDILIENNDFLGNDSCFYGISVNHFNNVNVINNRLKDAGFTSLSVLIDSVIDSNQFIMTKLTNDVTMRTNDSDQRVIIRNNLFNSLKVPLPTANFPDHPTVYFRGDSLEIVNNTLINQASGIFATCSSSRIEGNQIHASHYSGISSNGASVDIVNNVITGAGSLNGDAEAVLSSQAIVIGESAINNYVANNIIRKESADDYYPDYFKSTSNPNGKVPAHVNTAIVLENKNHSKPLYTTLNSNHVYGGMRPYALADINFRDSLAFLSQVVGVGSSNVRPGDAIIGSVFFDTTLGKPIFCKLDAANSGTQVWVDSTGTKV